MIIEYPMIGFLAMCYFFVHVLLFNKGNPSESHFLFASPASEKILVISKTLCENFMSSSIK